MLNTELTMESVFIDTDADCLLALYYLLLQNGCCRFFFFFCFFVLCPVVSFDLAVIASSIGMMSLNRALSLCEYVACVVLSAAIRLD